MNVTHSRKELKERLTAMLRQAAPENLAESITELPDSFKRTMARAQKREHLVPFGAGDDQFKFLTAATGGIRKGGITAICGPSGFGKTTLLATFWMKFHSMGLPIFTAPIENGQEDFMEIVISALTGKARGSMNAGDWEACLRSHALFFANRRHVFSNHESRVDHLDLLTEIWYAHLTRGTCIAIVDTWQFMLALKNSRDAFFESERAFHEMAVFTKYVPVHIFVSMHPNKDGLERVEDVGAIKGSTSLVQESHNILLFNPLGPKEDAPLMVEHDFCREVEIAKARYNGRAKGTKILFYVDASSELYKEYKVL